MASSSPSTSTPALPATVPPVVLVAQIIPPPCAPGDMTDRELASAAAEAIEKHLSMRSGSIEYAIRAGELLREAKRRCDAQGSSWADWQRRYWLKSETTAKRYMALALEVQGSSGPRADRLAALLALPSVRAALTDTGYDAGSTRDEPGGLREPGADEDEESDEAVKARLLAQGDKDKAESETERKQRIEDWKARKQAEKRQGLDASEAARRAASTADEAKKRAEREREMDAERAAVKAAEDRPAGPEAPRPRPPAPVSTEMLSAAPTCDAMEQIVLSAQRRWADLRMEPAPMVEQKFGPAVMHPRDEFASYVAEWVNAGPEIIRHLQNMKAEDVKVVRALKRAASVTA